MSLSSYTPISHTPPARAEHRLWKVLLHRAGHSFDHWETNKGYWNMLSAANLGFKYPLFMSVSRCVLCFKSKLGFLDAWFVGVSPTEWANNLPGGCSWFSRSCQSCGCGGRSWSRGDFTESAHWVGGCRKYKDAAPGIRCQGNCAKIETKKNKFWKCVQRRMKWCLNKFQSRVLDYWVEYYQNWVHHDPFGIWFLVRKWSDSLHE